ncbi:MAG: hypothetical protein AABY22_16595, partial [Nanoarchaeota archaeon]
MALGTDYIIRYLSDISDAVSGAKKLEDINSKISSTIGEKFATATRILGTNLQKISSTPIKIDGKSATKDIQELGTIVQTTSGKFAREKMNHLAYYRAHNISPVQYSGTKQQ